MYFLLSVYIFLPSTIVLLDFGSVVSFCHSFCYICKIRTRSYGSWIYTTEFVSLHPAQARCTQYVIKFASDFSPGTALPTLIKLSATI